MSFNVALLILDVLVAKQISMANHATYEYSIPSGMFGCPTELSDTSVEESVTPSARNSQIRSPANVTAAAVTVIDNVASSPTVTPPPTFVGISPNTKHVLDVTLEPGLVHNTTTLLSPFMSRSARMSVVVHQGSFVAAGCLYTMLDAVPEPTGNSIYLIPLLKNSTVVDVPIAPVPKLVGIGPIATISSMPAPVPTCPNCDGVPLANIQHFDENFTPGRHRLQVISSHERCGYSVIKSTLFFNKR